MLNPPPKRPSDDAEEGPSLEEKMELANLEKLATLHPAQFQALMLQGILRQATALEDIAEAVETMSRMMPEPP